MPTDDDADSRYVEIMRRIANRQQAVPQSLDPVVRILNSLNVIEPLEAMRRRRKLPILCYGPATRRKPDVIRVVVWYMPKGDMQAYKTLTLFGIWAVGEPANLEIIVGTRSLNYQASVYTPEAFWKLIRQDYATYYQDDGQPPQASSVLYQTSYSEERRLEIRQQIADVIQAWQDGLNSDP
ncbi:MAG: hypothetical protein KC546_03115 [Anaerolineae bacterium]|nr:hypothetical protein [Anaerolineae bacterium]